MVQYDKKKQFKEAEAKKVNPVPTNMPSKKGKLPSKKVPFGGKKGSKSMKK